MGRWISGAGRWQDCHFVLTRSGFLHWLQNAGHCLPIWLQKRSPCDNMQAAMGFADVQCINAVKEQVLS